MAAGKTHDINRPGLSQLVRSFVKDQMKAAVQDLRRMTGLTAKDLPGWRPLLFFATIPESYDDGYKALQKYVVGKVGVQHLSVWQVVAGRRMAC